MRPLAVFCAVSAFVASNSLAAQLVPVPVLDTQAPHASSEVYALSTDGRYVAGMSPGLDGTKYRYIAVYWDMHTAGYPATKNLNGGVASRFAGFERRSGSFYSSGLNLQASQNTSLGRAGTATSWNVLRDQANGYRATVGAFNSTAMVTDGTGQWVAGGGTSIAPYGSTAYLWKRSVYAPNNMPMYRVLGTDGQAFFNSVSSSGRAVGFDTVILSNGHQKVPSYFDPGAYNQGVMNYVPKPSAPYDGEYLNGQTYGISDDGDWLCGAGLPTKTTPTGPQTAPLAAAFRWCCDTPNSELLEPVEGINAVFDGTASAVALDITPDGFAVGYDWPADTLIERAAIWFPGETKARLLLPYMELCGVDTTGWDSLERAYSTTLVGSNYVISGNGTYEGQLRGFYVVIPTTIMPEPASLGLLTLGGMALLRRRR